MRKLITGMKVSVDGKIEGAERMADWVQAWSEDYGLMPQLDACVLGAGMYPGYERYARSLVEEVVPELERRGIRAESHRRYRSVWGSSLGGVVSFYTVWQHPDVFGSAVCMSSTFSHKDDLIDRVFTEPFRDVGFYLDSGWPGDNYEVTVGMAMALISRGWEYGRNLLHLCFPMAGHSETAWGTRLHLPLQFLNGAVARAYRVNRPVLGEQPFARPTAE